MTDGLQANVTSALALLRLSAAELSPGHWRIELEPARAHPGIDVRLDVEAGDCLLALRAKPQVAYGPEVRAELLEAVNHWHLDRRWPRLYVCNHCDDHTIEADSHLVLTDQAGVELVATSVAAFIDGCVAFWSTFHGPMGTESLLAAVARLVDDRIGPCAPPPVRDRHR